MGIARTNPRKFDTSVPLIARNVHRIGRAFLQRYAVLKPLPKKTADIESLAANLHARMVDREAEAIQKLRRVIEFATGDDCQSFHRPQESLSLIHCFAKASPMR